MQGSLGLGFHPLKRIGSLLHAGRCLWSLLMKEVLLEGVGRMGGSMGWCLLK
ncbi:hypothetical protein GGR08_000551 [Bartonella fuyuanensis]|uniref:Uncharacterized protein n=1 Tax=Bartonella fuyuanensis TaxID=1460968 RepID=A0A840E245_9HYPH|nr:hypothetical protein [Bartonella fuyuanensis]MBB4076258.1 hypothetical protein [Bartonella fuyuanensis]